MYRMFLIWILAAVLLTCPLRCYRCGEVSVDAALNMANLERCGGCCQSHRGDSEGLPDKEPTQHRDCECRFCACNGALPALTEWRLGLETYENFLLEEYSFVKTLNAHPLLCWRATVPRFGIWEHGRGIRIACQSFQI